MASVFFLLGVVSIAVIVFWAIRNDAAPPDGPTTGWLAMLPEALPADPTTTAAPKRGARPAATGRQRG